MIESGNRDLADDAPAADDRCLHQPLREHPGAGHTVGRPTVRLGQCSGGACVSEKHANFIINTGNASAADIEVLIEKIATTVEQQQGVRLIPEVRIVGERPPGPTGLGLDP